MGTTIGMPDEMCGLYFEDLEEGIVLPPYN